MELGRADALRTRVYIDGYNLYFGCLKNTACKWLDIRLLVEKILASVSYERDGKEVAYRFANPAIKYFTALILESFAKSVDSMHCQIHYHDALAGYLGEDFEMISGYYHARPARAHKWEDGKAARECDQIEIWKLEEKQSDVALALHAFSDAIHGEVDQVILVTNDSDLEPAMQLIRERTSTIIGLIAPIRPATGDVNTRLAKHAHWIRRHILDNEISSSQLPSMVRHHQNVVHKPLSWYPRPDLLIPIYKEAKRVRGSAGAARRWLNQPCPHLAGQIPITMCEHERTARDLRNYMDRYARDFGVSRSPPKPPLTR